MFDPKPKKITIVSNLLCYGTPPEPGDEISQRITINHKGQVWFCTKTRSDSTYWEEVPLRKVRAKIDADIAMEILDRINMFFQISPFLCEVTDVGEWQMALTMEDGYVFKEHCSLGTNPELNVVSNFIRSVLPELRVVAFGEGNDE